MTSLRVESRRRGQYKWRKRLSKKNPSQRRKLLTEDLKLVRKPKRWAYASFVDWNGHTKSWRCFWIDDSTTVLGLNMFLHWVRSLNFVVKISMIYTTLNLPWATTMRLVYGINHLAKKKPLNHPASSSSEVINIWYFFVKYWLWKNWKV